MALTAIVLVLLVPALATQAGAQPSSDAVAAGSNDTLSQGTVGAGNRSVAPQGTQAVVLIHHPYPDFADPFGVPFGEGPAGRTDTFSARYGHLVADVGRFDYPYFVADGVLPVRALPDPAVPYASTVDAYMDAAAQRLEQEPPVALTLTSRIQGPGPDGIRMAAVEVGVEPRQAIGEPQGQRLRLLVALAEDAIHYEPPAAVSNGVADHRFTVRALQDLGPIDLTHGAPVALQASLPVGNGWDTARMSVAAWVQADAAPGRFQPHEVLQATAAPLGSSVRQDSKAVLAEGYSATWCNPCLYGDLALEQLAIRHAGAAPLEPATASYFPGWTAGRAAAALAGGAGLAMLAVRMGRRP